MLQEIELGKSGLRAPAIGFGCAAIMGRTGRTKSLRALDVAWNEGIRFFDTARSYGYGESEALLGAFLKGRRHEAVVSTKFGILPARQAAWKGFAKGAIRSLLSFVPSARPLLRRAVATQITPNQFTVPILHRSVEESLRALQTDYVDILFLHAPPTSVLEQRDLLEAMGTLVKQGKVRLAGLSAEPTLVERTLQRQIAPLRAMQFPCNVFNLSLSLSMVGENVAGAVLVANHPFGGISRVQACRTLLRQFAASPEIDPVLREKLGTVDDQVLADVVFGCILRDTGIHVVIPAMMRENHVRSNVRAIREFQFTSAELRIIRNSLFAKSVHTESFG